MRGMRRDRKVRRLIQVTGSGNAMALTRFTLQLGIRQITSCFWLCELWPGLTCAGVHCPSCSTLHGGMPTWTVRCRCVR